MENLSLFNLIMAATIAVIIAIIAIVKKPKIKAIIYGLPIPTTLALIAMQKPVDSSYIVGLFLLVGFLWLVLFLSQLGAGIILADIFSVLVYTGSGYFLLKFIPKENFYLLAFIYFVFWILFTISVKHLYEKDDERKKLVNPLLKVAVVFPLALSLLYLKDVLSGVVATFPFSGVFAVVEMRYNLRTLAWEFTRNSSIGILAFSVLIYLLTPLLGLNISIIIGWTAYLPTLKLVSKLP